MALYTFCESEGARSLGGGGEAAARGVAALGEQERRPVALGGSGR